MCKKKTNPNKYHPIENYVRKNNFGSGKRSEKKKLNLCNKNEQKKLRLLIEETKPE